MDISIIRELAEKHEGGIKKLASEIGMSEANLHRCINNNKIQAGDLEMIAIKLDVDIRTFFDIKALKLDSLSSEDKNAGLLQLCREIVINYQQRDKVMSQLVSMVNSMQD